MKFLKKFNESSNTRIQEFINSANKIINHDSEYEQGEEPSNTDILSELGDLCNKMDFNAEEIQQVIDSGEVLDTNRFLQIILDETLSSEKSMGNKPNSNEKYVLLTHHESGDEIHFTLVKHSLYQEIDRVFGDDPSRIPHSDIDYMLEKIHSEKIKSVMCQSYVLQNWPFNGYNIVKVINLPELGM